MWLESSAFCTNVVPRTPYSALIEIIGPSFSESSIISPAVSAGSTSSKCWLMKSLPTCRNWRHALHMYAYVRARSSVAWLARCWFPFCRGVRPPGSLIQTTWPSNTMKEMYTFIILSTNEAPWKLLVAAGKETRGEMPATSGKLPIH